MQRTKANAFLHKSKLRFALVLCCITQLPCAMADVQQVRYWDWGATPSRDDYEIAVLQAALEASTPHFGDYQLERVVKEFTTQRVRRELLRGEIINVQPGPWRELGDQDASSRPLRIDVDFYKGLLGYRRLFILRSHLNDYRPVPDESSLKNFIIGQVKGWVDVEIYKFNGYRVNDEANLSSLFDMLRVGRFDHLAMSAAEESTLLTAERRREFAAVHGLLIYFSLPMVFYVSPTEPKLAERIEEGMKRISQNGTLNRIFDEHYADLLKKLKAESPVIYRLENPNIPDFAKRLIGHELLP